MWKVKWIGILCMTVAVLSACGTEKSQGTGEVLLYENGEAASGSAVSQEDYETTKVRQETYKEEYYDTADLDYTDTETIYIDDEDRTVGSGKIFYAAAVCKSGKPGCPLSDDSRGDM